MGRLLQTTLSVSLNPIPSHSYTREITDLEPSLVETTRDGVQRGLTDGVALADEPFLLDCGY